MEPNVPMATSSVVSVVIVPPRSSFVMAFMHTRYKARTMAHVFTTRVSRGAGRALISSEGKMARPPVKDNERTVNQHERH